MEFNNKYITKGYQEIPREDYMWNLPSGKDDCEICEGSGDVQCCAGEHYYIDDCNCRMIKYWEDKGNEFMADGHRKMLANTLKWRNI